jgi:5'-nucleotidase / UDP-sugar diphosphatase
MNAHPHRLFALFALFAAAVLAAPSCGPKAQPPVVVAPAPEAKAKLQPVSVTILYTTDEHGWLQPVVEKGEVRGGAAEILSHWVVREGHCPARPTDESGAAVAEPLTLGLDCADPATLLLSGGDNWTGPAISSFYNGQPMAEALKRMGYAASAFGNHEFDFGREHFVKNRERSGFPYLAANLRVKDPKITDLNVAPFAVFERRGVKIGVVGLATDTTLIDAAASNFKGIEFEAEEPALDRAVADAWAAEPDALVLIAHECPDKLEPILERHPEWELSFVGAGHCHKLYEERAGNVPVIAPGWRFFNYARVQMKIDKNKPLRSRVLEVNASVVEVSRPADAAPVLGPDPIIHEMRAAWQRRLDQALGEPIGFTASGIEQRSPEMGRWVADAWRAELQTDVAVVNEGALRQAIPKGPITKATVYSVLPFDNKLMICSITGKDLIDTLSNQETITSGLSRAPAGGYMLAGGAPIEPGRRYTVATIDFLYFGGSGFLFKKQDPNPKETGLDWRTPVIEWTKRQRTTPEDPLERRLRR